MADVTQTAANVRKGNGSTTGMLDAGEVLVGGETLYKKSDGKAWKADANLTAVEANCIGTALHPTNVDQPVTYAKIGEGEINIGGTLVRGKVYVVSATAGKFCPIEDLATAGQFVTIMGFAKNTTTLDQSIAKVTGVVI